MIIVASANGDVGIGEGMDILRRGGSALDAVEAACRLVEDNVDDHSVGTGGYPNLEGVVELDASIMDGSDRRAGAVAGLKDFPYPISVARAVLEKLPQHLLLVGDGAARFAAEQGFEKRELLTESTRTTFRDRYAQVRGEAYSFGAVTSGPSSTLLEQVTDPSKTSGTVNFIAQDDQGRIAAAVSTSGWAFKYPGRAGDSPIIGSGNYCDSRFGACACTGLGEWAIRSSTARVVVLMMQLGHSLEEACRFAVSDLYTITIPKSIDPTMNLVALDRDGNHIGCSTMEGRTYIWQDETMLSFETTERRLIAEDSD